MSARQLIGKTFDPTTLVVMGTAFDRAWSEIAHHFGETDVQLATEALQVLALTYRSRWPLNWQ